MNKDCYYNKTMNFSLKATIRGLLVETPEVLSVPRVWQGARSDYLQYHIGSFPIRS